MTKNYTAFQSVAKLVGVLLFMPLLLLATGDRTKLTLENLSSAENAPIEVSSSNDTPKTTTNNEHASHTNGMVSGLGDLAPPCDIHVDAGSDKEICADEPIHLNASVQNNNVCSTGCVYPILDVDKCNGSHRNGSETFFLNGDHISGDERRFYASSQSFETFDDGTAKFLATVSNGDDTVLVDITYSGRTTTPPSFGGGSPKEPNHDAACQPHQDVDNFVYYPNMVGTIESQEHGTFTLSVMGPAFQIGVGGDVTRNGFGASGWFEVHGGDGFYDRGDVNIPLGDCQPQGNNDTTYHWSTDDGNIIGNANTQNIQVDQPGTYTVQVTNCEGCVATDEVVITSFSVDAGDDVTVCPDEDVVLTANPSSEPQCSTCDESGSFSGRHQSVYYDLADCRSFASDGSNYDYSEFTPAISNLDFATVSASIVNRHEGPHSCTTRDQPGRAACFGFGGADSQSFVDDAPTAVRFDYTLNADKGQAAKLDSFSFDELAPVRYRQTNQWNNRVNRGRNNYPTRFGIRVLKNGQEIFKQVDIATSRHWINRFIDFGSYDDFIVAEGDSATFSFELYAYRQHDNNGDKSVWDLDTIRINASSCEGESTSDIDYLWSNGETTQSITVSPDETTTYSVTATSCSGCSATDEVTVTIGEGTADAGPDVEICEGEEAILTASGGETYLWNTGETTAEITVTDAGEYTVEVTGDTGCKATDSVIVTVTDPWAGTISPNPANVCLDGNDVMITGIPAGDASVPDGYTMAFVLTSGDGLVIQDLSSTPEFMITQGGKYTIHPFVYPSSFDPSSVIEFGSTTGFDVNALLVQGGGDLCASLDVVGAMVIVSDPDSGTVTPVAGTVCLEAGTVGISASPNGDADIPDGYTLAYILTSGDDLVIQDLSVEPEFDVAADGKYTIHPFVYPSSFDPLSVVVPGVTTGAEVNALLVQGGGDLCASLDVAGAMVIVEDQVSIGNYVWNDVNQDGCQDGEMGVNGVTVTLFECADGVNPTGSPIASMETQDDSNGLPGYYNFEVCKNSGEYIVVFDIPTGFEATESNNCSDDTTDSDITDSGNSGCFEILDDDNLTVDAGIFDPVNVGDTVFYDNDRDGVQDPGEDGVAGVTVQLKDTAGNVVAETVTDANGNYLFEAVPPGDYVIMFVPGSLPDDYVFSPADQGGDDATDSDADENGNTQPFTVTAGQDDDLTFDAGINLPTASLGDTVFLDENQNGIQDPGEEGVPGVTVSLYICGEDTPIATTTTDANGNYEFADLEPNTEYFVEFIAPSGLVFSPQDQGGDDASDSDAGEDGRTNCIELGPGENNPTIDAGVYEPCPEDFANAGPDEAICNGDEVTLTASGGDSYLWNNGETTASITVSPTADTVYTVTVTTAVVCVDTDEVLVTVNDVTAIAGDDVSACQGEEVTLTASGGESYLWNTGETTASITVSPTAETAYTVTVTSAEGCTDTDEVVVSINPEVVANAGADMAVCLGDSATLTASGGESYLWSTGETSASITVSPTAETAYTVTVTSAEGCVDTDEVVVSINPIVIAIAGDDVAVCIGESATLTASGGESYLWNTGETSPSITVSPTVDSTYTVEVTSAEGCTDTDEVVVSINPEVVADAGPDVAICPGDSASLTASGGGSYLWNTGETTASITVSPTAETVYTVTVTSPEGCTDTAEVVVSINPEVVANAGADIALCLGDSATLTASGGGNYLWNTGETTASITVSPTAETAYSVTVTSAEGCTDTDEVVVSINPEVVANAGADMAVCLGDSATLTASGGGSYLWNTGETTASITVSPTAETEYSVTVTSTEGCVDTDEVVVSINPEVVADAGNDVTSCSGESVTLTASGGASYLWNTGETTASIEVAPTADTTYTVTVTSAEGCTDTDEVFVDVDDKVSIGDYVWNDLNENGVQDDGDSGINGVTATLYQCNNGTNSGGTMVSSTVTANDPATSAPGYYSFDVCQDSGEYYIVFGAPDGSGFTTGNIGDDALDSDADANGATGCFTAGTSDIPTIDAGLVSLCDIDVAVTGEEEICLGEEALIVAIGGDTYLWSNGETTASITVAPTETTTYMVTVTDSAIPDCSAELSFTVDVQSVDIDAGPDVSIEFGGSTTLTVSGAGPTDTILWSTGESTSSITVAPVGTTTYSVTVVNALGCVGEDTVTVNVNSACGINPAFKILPRDQPGVYTPGGSTAACLGDNLYLWMHMDPDNLDDGLAEDYSDWSFTFEFPNGEVLVQDNRPIWPGNQRTQNLDLQEEDFGDYKISWVSPDGCAGFTVFTLNFPDGDSCGPNGTRISDFYALGAVYPVPAASGSTITLEVNTKTHSISTAKGASTSRDFVVPSSKTTIRVSLYNLSGRLVETPQSYDIETGMVKVYHELSNLPTGTYILRVDGDEWFDSENIIIK